MAQSEAILAEEAAGTAKSAYNVVMADGYHPPQVDEIDLTGYIGEGGEVIRAKVWDDVQVEAENVVIAIDADVLVEQGQMTQATTRSCGTSTPPRPIVRLDQHG